MATFSHIVVVLAISVVVLLPVSTMAAEYVVGGNSGWTTGYNYTAWAQGKVFYVGDKLGEMFKLVYFLLYFSKKYFIMQTNFTKLFVCL